MIREIKLIKIFLTLIFAIIIFWGLILQINPEKNTNWNYLFNSGFGLLFTVGGILNIWYQIKLKINGNSKYILDFLGLSLISYGVALFLWTYYNFAYAQAIPSPALSDIFFVFFYPFAFVSTFFFLKSFSFLITRKILKQISIASIIILILVLGVFIRPEISKDFPFWINFLNVYYSLMSALILILALTVLGVSGGESTKSAIWLSFGLMFHGIGSFFYSIRIINGTYWNGDYSDIFIAVSAYLITMAGINIIASLIPNKDNTK